MSKAGADADPLRLGRVVLVSRGEDEGGMMMSDERQAVFAPGTRINEVVRFDYDATVTAMAARQGALHSDISSTVAAVCEGHSASVVLMGEDGPGKYALAHGPPSARPGGARSLLSQCAGELFRRLGTRKDAHAWRPVVRMAWYQVRRDKIRDILRATASGGPGAGASSSAGGGSDAPQAPTLTLRDDPMLGPVVPGLWEV